MKYKTLKYFKSITLILSIAKIRENCILELADESKFVKFRALENNQLYGSRQVVITVHYVSIRLCLDANHKFHCCKNGAVGCVSREAVNFFISSLLFNSYTHVHIRVNCTSLCIVTMHCCLSVAIG